MRPLSSVSLTVVLSTLFMPALGMASEPHSWCVPGAGLNTDGSTDATTNKTIDYVCGLSPKGSGGFGDCCVQTVGIVSTPRWSLACVQKAADYAMNTLNAGDVCGRYAWAQGPIANTQQYYPRDFSLFTLGDATGLGDVSGPVAAQGNVTASSFALNGSEQDPVALVAQGAVTLKVGGTVYGAVYYSSTSSNGFSDTTSVHYANGGTRPTKPTNPSPVNFATASTALLNMSKQLNIYDVNGTTSPPSNHAITFTGTDPELNVFSFPSSYLTNTTVFTFKVPSGSAVIINVSGNPVFANAGYNLSDVTKLNLQSVLWNFPSATKLTLSSTTIPGSILAPQAAATLTNGAIFGTVVAKSAALSLQLDWNPYQVPSSTGCLFLDASWSCSEDTALDDTGHATAIKAEAGFLDIPLDNYTAESTNRTSPEHRIWYAFQPARTTPKSKSLAVFFNGGPGSATSSVLFSFNTANMTLDPNDPNTGATGIAANPNSWSRFANLLYIDAPATGFSYPLGYHDPVTDALVTPDIGIDILRDAGIFLQVITRFLVRHPALLGNRVILTAESYGGTRVTLMLDYLYNYSSLTDPTIYQDSQVLADLNSYFSAVLGTQTPDPTRQIATRFGHQVMIEPSVVDPTQNSFAVSDEMKSPQNGCLPSNNPTAPCSYNGLAIPATCDPDNCDKSFGWADGQVYKAAVNLNNIATLNAALGVDATTITWMYPSFRSLAYGRNNGTHCGDGTTSSPADAFSSQDMKTAFGKLMSVTDCYFVIQNDEVHTGYVGAAPWDDAGDFVGYHFLANLQANVATFITVAQYDQNVWSPAIQEALSDLANPNDPNNPSKPNPSGDKYIENLVSSVAYSSSYPTDIAARPGSMAITYKSPVTTVRVTMPTSYLSGHTVSMRAPAALLADVIQWYTDSPH
jgi:choice-of-anchor A domain-containing protein